MKKRSGYVVLIILLSLTFPLRGLDKILLIKSQWNLSAHAKSIDSKEKAKKVNISSCAPCHTAQGFREVILDKKQSTAPYKDVTGLTCQACHQGDKDNMIYKKLWAGDVKNACTGCHNRIFQNDQEDFSTCPQGSIVSGSMGFNFGSSQFPSGQHSKIKKNCAGCHMADSSEGFGEKAGGHTFRVMTKGDKTPILNSKKCLDCHKVMNVKKIRESQKEVKILLGKVASLLPQYLKGEQKRKGEIVKIPEDPSLNKVEAQASYNYYQILRDGTFGIHNPVFTRALLKNTIKMFKDYRKK